MSLESIVKMLAGGLSSYQAQAAFSCCNDYTAKNHKSQDLFIIFSAVFCLQQNKQYMFGFESIRLNTFCVSLQS